MIGILLITHGSYGEALVQNACHVLNKRPVQLNQLGVAAQDDPLDLLPLARQMLNLVDNGKGVLVLTDIFGATPANLALKLLEPGRIEGHSHLNAKSGEFRIEIALGIARRHVGERRDALDL